MSCMSSKYEYKMKHILIGLTFCSHSPAISENLKRMKSVKEIKMHAIYAFGQVKATVVQF